MRTTVNIDDDLMRVVRSLAESNRLPLGEVLSDLLRKGLQARAAVGDRSGFPVFDVEEGARSITLEDVQRADDEW